MGDAAKRGKWWAGRNDEWFTAGPLESREDALHEGRIIAEEYEQDHFWIGEGDFHAVHLRAGRLIESQYFENEDWFSCEDGPEPERKGEHEAADRELQELLDAWVERHRATFIQPTTFAWLRSECISIEAVE